MKIGMSARQQQRHLIRLPAKILEKMRQNGGIGWEKNKEKYQR
jgi:hypothetical protein